MHKHERALFAKNNSQKSPKEQQIQQKKIAELATLLASLKELKKTLKEAEKAESSPKKVTIQARVKELEKAMQIKAQYYDSLHKSIEALEVACATAIKSMEKADKLTLSYTPGKLVPVGWAAAGLAMALFSSYFLPKGATKLSFTEVKNVLVLGGLFLGAAFLGMASYTGSKAEFKTHETIPGAVLPAVLIIVAFGLCLTTFFEASPKRLINSINNESLLVLAAMVLSGGTIACILGLAVYNRFRGKSSEGLFSLPNKILANNSGAAAATPSIASIEDSPKTSVVDPNAVGAAAARRAKQGLKEV